MECMEVERKEEVAEGCKKLKIQKNYYKETFKFIDEALKLEDRGKHQEAILCYNKSLRSITNGVNTLILPEEVTPDEFKQYETIKQKLSKAQQEVLHRLGTLNVTDSENMDTNQETETPSNHINKEEEAFRVNSTHDNISHGETRPTAPPDYEESVGNRTWHDTKELIHIEEGVRLFHVNGIEISTWVSHCALQIFQIFKEQSDDVSPPAFLKCGEWLFPMEPGQSPVLKTAHRTYMFPDMVDSGKELTDPSTLPCVGIVLADIVPETLITRFERVLSLYTDFRKELPGIEKEKPKRPPPPVLIENGDASSSVQRSNGRKSDSSSQVVATSDIETIVAVPGVRDDQSINEESRWSAAVTKGIHIGSQWISWGFLKGSQYASTFVEKGSVSLQKRIKPNPESKAVSPEISQNLRQLHQTTGSVVQISSFLASTLGNLIINLGKNLAPLVVHHGQKLLPDKYKVENNEKTQNVIDNAKKVAVAGLQGFSLVFLALEQSGKNLYQSISKAAVETMQHKYGEEVGEVTSDAMGAAGNTAQVIWNVRKLGPKAIAKRTAKETGKAILEYDNQENPFATYHKDGIKKP